jgi:hypothetical protein
VLCVLTKAINRHGIPEPITTAQRGANAGAMASDNIRYGTAIPIRQVKCLTSVVEQDHRAVTPMPYPMLGCKSMETAQCTRGASNSCIGVEEPMGRRGQARASCRPNNSGLRRRRDDQGRASLVSSETLRHLATPPELVMRVEL